MRNNVRVWVSIFVAFNLTTNTLFTARAATSPSEPTSASTSTDEDRQTALPLRAPLSLKIDLKGLSKGQTAALQSLSTAIENELSYWLHFPIELPPTQFQEGAKLIELNDLYQVPTSDEADDLAFDSNGDRLRLNAHQIEQLHQEGVIRVPSKEYPGMEFVWRVSALIQEGQKNIELRLQKDEATGLRHLIVSVPLWFRGHYGATNTMPISVRGGLRNILLGVRNSISDIIGLVEKTPKYRAADVDQIIAREKTKYLITTVQKDSPTTDFSQIYDADIMSKAQDVLVAIDNKVNADFEARRAEIEDPIRAALYKEGESAIQDALNLHFSELILAEIAKQRDRFEAINPGLTDAILHRARAIPLIYEGEQILLTAMHQERARIVEQITKKEPVKARIPEWLELQVEKAMKPVILELEKQNYELIAQNLEKNQLSDEAKIVRAQFAFMLAQAPTMRTKLTKEQVPTRELHFPLRIRNSKNWKIQAEQYTNRETQQIETYYTGQMYEDAKVVTSMPLWRLWAAWNSSRYILRNGLYHLVVTNLLNGPVGINHVFKKDPFSNQNRVNPKTGVIEADPESLTTTVRSRTKALWESVADSEARFEAAQPVGFFNKDLMRVVHTVKNRYIRGYMGTAAIWGCGALCTMANITITSGLVATSFVWAPMTSIFMMGFDAVVYDTKGGSSRASYGRVNRFAPLLSHLLGQAGIKGIGMTIGGTLGTLVHQGVGMGRIAYGRLRSSVVTNKDALLRNFLVNRAYVPKGNDFVTQLIAGPGLTSEFYYQIKPEISVMGLMATLEQTELATFNTATQSEIDRPVKEFKAFFNQSIEQAVALTMNSTLDKYPELIQSTSLLSAELSKQVQGRAKLYSSLLGNEKGVNRQLIKQSKEDLATTLRLSEELVKDYFTQKTFATMNDIQIANFWRQLKLPQNEWHGLTRSLLAQTFSEEFLSPLEETDARFHFVVKNEGLARDLQRVIAGKKIDEGHIVPVIEPGRGTQEKDSVPKTRMVNARDVIPDVLLVNTCKRALNKTY